MEIIAKSTILFKGETNLGDQDDVSFVVQASNSIQAKVTIQPKQKAIEVYIDDYPVSTDTLEYLVNHNLSSVDKSPKNIQIEISKIHSLLSDCTVRVLSLIKYHLPYPDLSEQLFSSRSWLWKTGKSDWKSLPSSLSFAIDSRTTPRLDRSTSKLLQDSLDEGILPLIGMRYLHKAKNEFLPHHKWIEATIAAELAVKEVLIRACPELEALMLEVPSPPLTKLYGSVLKAYLGQRSPYLNVIRDGVEVRNRLLHRPSSERVDGQKAINYTDDIERAIFHLLSLLYPDNDLVRMRLKMITHS